MGGLIQEREEVLGRRLAQMREMDEWHLFQNFILGLLTYDGYSDVRLSNVRSDFGRDGVALTPDGLKCFVAVSFDCSLKKIRHDARRWSKDPNREVAAVMIFAANKSPSNIKVSQWVAKVKRDYGLELRLFNRKTILSTATRESVWRETCARLGIAGYRQGYVKIAPYDSEVVRRALHARPPEWLSQRVPLGQWDELTTTVPNRLIFGKPGAGKTTTIFEQLERAQPDKVLVVEPDLSEASQIEALLDQAAGGAVIVYDDFHAHHKTFVQLCHALLARRRDPEPRTAKKYEKTVLLAATRSQEWQDIAKEMPLTLLGDLGLLGEAEWTLKDLDVEKCRRLIEICRDEWELVIEDRLLRQAAEAAAERDATPLFVISMLAAARGRSDRTLRDEHLAGLPQNVRDLWSRYWDALDATAQGVLRLVRLFWAARTPPHAQLLNEAAKFFSIAPADLSNRLDVLERSLWLTRTAGVPAGLDVQLEAIDLDDGWYGLWDDFVFSVGAGTETRLQLHTGTGIFYADYVAPRSSGRAEYRSRREALARHFGAVAGLARDSRNRKLAAFALNNSSASFAQLAALETTREARRALLEKAVAAVEESIAIGRELGVRGDQPSSLNNVSVYYSDLARFETTRDGRRALLEKAVAAVEESVDICRERRMRGELALSLNNVSNHYSDLAELETTGEGRRARREKAVAAVEESVRICRELGVRVDLAMSLNNVSIRYGDLASLESTREGRSAWLEKAAAVVEEAVGIHRKLGLRVDLANSLNNLSIHYSALADGESTRQGRRALLEKAVATAEKSVAIRREFGVRGDLGTSLGSLCLHQRALVEADVDPVEVTRRLTLSREAIDEAVALFREAGDMPYLLNALQEAVFARMALAKTGADLAVGELTKLVDEGLALATSLEKEQKIAFFTDLKRALTEGDTG